MIEPSRVGRKSTLANDVKIRDNHKTSADIHNCSLFMIDYASMNSRAKSLVLNLGQELGAIRPRDLRVRGFRPEYLWQLYKEGKLKRSVRGVYYLNDANLTE